MRIKELREREGLTMKQASEALEIPYTTYVNYEKGYREMPNDTLVKIADYFNCSTDYLLGRTDNEFINDDEELTEFLEHLRTRPQLKMIFSLTKNATLETVERTVKVIEAMLGNEWYICLQGSVTNRS